MNNLQFQEAGTIRKNANDAKNEAQNLHIEADNLRSRIASTESRFGKLEDLANKDDKLTENAKAKVGQAKTDSEEVQKQAQKALDSIKAIISELSNMKEISIQDLDLLGNIEIKINSFSYANELYFYWKTKNWTLQKQN